MHPTDLEPVFSEVVQREKWTDPSLNENNAGVGVATTSQIPL